MKTVCASQLTTQKLPTATRFLSEKGSSTFPQTRTRSLCVVMAAGGTHPAMRAQASQAGNARGQRLHTPRPSACASHKLPQSPVNLLVRRPMQMKPSLPAVLVRGWWLCACRRVCPIDSCLHGRFARS